MTCFFPNQAFISRDVNSLGKHSVYFAKYNQLTRLNCDSIGLPCGTCIGCRFSRIRNWVIRMKHEASLHLKNSFITLTYDNAHLPKDKGLHLEHYQCFMKRLRFHINKHLRYLPSGARRALYKSVRYYHVGEFGNKLKRPHYHAILFGFDFDDKVFFRKSLGGEKLYTSELLSFLWPYGFSSIGSVSSASIAYVARYSLKKQYRCSRSFIKKKNCFSSKDIIVSDLSYLSSDDVKNSYNGSRPEYSTMSRRPAIGHDWIVRYLYDVYPADSVCIDSVFQLPPRYYDKVLERSDNAMYLSIKDTRRLYFEDPDVQSENTPERLYQRWRVCVARSNALPRTLD